MTPDILLRGLGTHEERIVSKTLIPFSTPDLILRDDKPRFIKPSRSAQA